MMEKPILCLDFDGVLHSYTSGWRGADVIHDPPVEGAMRFLERAVEWWEVSILSSRSHQEGGIKAMQRWLRHHLLEYKEGEATDAGNIYYQISWPTVKPPALLTIDDRAMLFQGFFPDPEELLRFKPWNK